MAASVGKGRLRFDQRRTHSNYAENAHPFAGANNALLKHDCLPVRDRPPTGIGRG